MRERHLLRSQAVRGYIGEASAVEVGELVVVVLGIWIDVELEVIVDSLLLVPWAAKVVAESSGAVDPGNFWGDSLSAAY
jgi:hypothetical protein